MDSTTKELVSEALKRVSTVLRNTHPDTINEFKSRVGTLCDAMIKERQSGDEVCKIITIIE